MFAMRQQKNRQYIILYMVDRTFGQNNTMHIGKGKTGYFWQISFGDTKMYIIWRTLNDKSHQIWMKMACNKVIPSIWNRWQVGNSSWIVIGISSPTSNCNVHYKINDMFQGQNGDLSQFCEKLPNTTGLTAFSITVTFKLWHTCSCCTLYISGVGFFMAPSTKERAALSRLTGIGALVAKCFAYISSAVRWSYRDMVEMIEFSFWWKRI